MKIKSVKFIKSAQSIKDSIDPNFNEVVFMGRSNVGKSSFLNSLTNQKIAKISSTPGKTKLINFFEVLYENDAKTIFVDLPGFGYAKVSKKEQENWEKNLNNFISNRFKVLLNPLSAIIVTFSSLNLFFNLSKLSSSVFVSALFPSYMSNVIGIPFVSSSNDNTT